jgi:hypothetical protein
MTKVPPNIATGLDSYHSEGAYAWRARAWRAYAWRAYAEGTYAEGAYGRDPSEQRHPRREFLGVLGADGS